MNGVAIVGGGIAGLAAAFECSLRGTPFTLFEASSRLGGLIRTEHAAGFTIEAGADSMLAQKRAGLALCDELGLTPRLIPMQARTACVLAGTRLLALPSPSLLGIPATFRQLARYELLPPASRLRVALEPLVPRRRGRDDESIAAFFRRRFGRTAVERLAQPLLGGIHAGDIERLSLPALFPRLAEAERSGRGVLRWVRQTARISGGAGAFRSLAAGMGELVDALRARLDALDVRLEAPVQAITPVDRGWDVRSAAGAVRVGSVILACPAHVAARLLRPIDATAADLCAAVPYVSTASVALAWPREAVAHPLDGSGFVVARALSATRLTACTWVSSKWPGRAPAGHVLLRAYLGGAHDPDAVALTDEDMIGVAVRELSAILSITGPPVLARAYRWIGAGAQHEVGHQARTTALEERLRASPGLHVAGSGFRAVGVPDCIADGRAVAASIGASRAPASRM